VRETGTCRLCSPKLSSLTAGVAFLLYNSVSVVHHQSSEQITAAAASLRKTKTEQNIVGLRMEELHREISVLEAQKASDGPDDEESQRVRCSRIHCSTCDQAQASPRTFCRSEKNYESSKLKQSSLPNK